VSLDSFFRYYFDERGWLLLSIFVAIIFAFTLIDNFRNNRGGLGWLVGMFVCLIAFVPAAIYDLGPEETREALQNAQGPIFIAGVLATIAPLLLLAGYWFSTVYQVQPNPAAGMEALPPAPQLMNDAPPTAFDPAPPIEVPPPIDAGPTMSPPQPVAYGDPPTSLNEQFVIDPNPGMTSSGATALPMNNGGASPAMQADAWLISVQNQQTRYPLKRGKNVIGRGTQHDINLVDDTVSRKGHALIIEKSGVYILRDMGSRYGTKLNGYEVAGDQQLYSDDVIWVGDTKLKFMSKK